MDTSKLVITVLTTDRVNGQIAKFINHKKLYCIMSLLWKKTYEYWNHNRVEIGRQIEDQGKAKEFSILFKNFTDLVREYLEKTVMINRQFNLTLDIHFKPSAIHKFIEKAKNITFPYIKGVTILSLFWLSDFATDDLNDLFSHSFENGIDQLYLEGGGDFGDLYELDNLSRGLKIILQYVKCSIHVERWRLNQNSISTILEFGCHIPFITISHWQMEYLKINYSLNPYSKINLKELNLTGTLWKQNEDYFDEENFDILIKALKNSKYDESLQKICFNDSEYPADDVQSIIDEYSLNVEVSCNPINIDLAYK